MAGAGIRLFEAGEILTAELVNSYLMDQVVPRFATATTRNSSFGGAGQPTLGAGDEGRLCYLDSTDEIQYWNGSTWVSIGNQAVVGIIAAKGDLVVGTTANTITNLTVGVNGKVLTADSSTATGVAWSSPTVDDLAITSAKIANLTIVDGNISATAAISLSKLATGALPTAITVTSANISDLSIVNADVASGAAIAASKIAGTAITAADTGTVTSTMIANDSILDADIKSNAAIAYSKLSLSGAITTTDLATGAARSGFRSHIVAQQGATHTIAASDVGGLVVLSSCTSVVIPTADGTFTVGDRIDFLQTGSQVVTFSATAPQIVGGFDAQTKLGGQYAVATLVKYAANTWVLVGNITS